MGLRRKHLGTDNLVRDNLPAAQASRRRGIAGRKSLSAELERLHSFHGYCARFSSDLAEAAILQYTRPGQSVFDPFCGSGTSLVAAAAHRRRAVGCDIDLLAGMLSSVKCAARPLQQYQRWKQPFVRRVADAIRNIAEHWGSNGCRARPLPGSVLHVGSLQLPIPVFAELNYWFPPQVVAALSAIATEARGCDDPHFQQVALIALSSCIISKWPTTLSYAVDIDHTRPHRRLQRIPLDRVLGTYLRRLDRAVWCLGQLHGIYASAGAADPADRPLRVICPHDARQPLEDAPAGSQSLILTSPPYFNAVDYPRSHRASVCWMNGHDAAELVSRSQYIGLRYAGGFDAEQWLRQHSEIRRLFPSHLSPQQPLGRRLCAFYADLEQVLHQSWRALRPGGHALYVIGDNVVRGRRIGAPAVLAALGRCAGLELIQSRPRTIASDRRRFPTGPFGFDGPMTHEHCVVFRKPMEHHKGVRIGGSTRARI
ncbi:DNA methyltransferase [Fontivita pretiosa]|uniref:DNA methyltransferase n=1 Tax=Fontivita pretiosa TaxID=2989684 RepID=UPI003D1874C6